MRNMIAILTLTPFGLLLTESALAQEKQEVKQLETLVITAGRVAEKAKNVTANMTVISRDEIKKNQYQDIGGLLRNYGLQIDSYTPNSGLSQISIRGVRSSAMGSDLQGSVLVMVDGRRIGTDNLSMIPMANIERVEIIRGPAAVQYGTSAIGGVINVITRRGTENLTASAEAGVGSWQTYRGQGDIAWQQGPVDFSLGVSSLTSDDYSVGGAGKYQNTALNYKTGYNANIGYRFLPEHRVGITLLGLKADDMGSPGYFNNISHDEYTNRSNYSVDLNYEGGSSEHGLTWMGRYFDGRNNYLNDKHNDTTGSSYFKSYTDYQGTQGQLSYADSLVTLTTGVDWLQYDTSMQGFYYPTHQNSQYDNLGLFLLGKLNLLDDKLIVSSGIRHDKYTLKISGDNMDMDNTTPSVGVALHATDWLTLRSNYGESYRIPDAIGLLGFQGMFSYVGNPDLKSEKGQTMDVGFDINHNSLELGLTYFHTDYKNKIALRYTPSWDAQYYNMDGKVKLRGLEAKASYDLGEPLDLSFKLRPYVNLTKMLERKDAEGKTVNNISNLDLAYGLDFNDPDLGLQVDLRFNYLGHQQVNDYNGASSTYGKIVTVGGKTTADLFVSKKIADWKNSGSLSVNAEIRNIANERYELIKDYPQPGRFYYAGLRYTY